MLISRYFLCHSNSLPRSDNAFSHSFHFPVIVRSFGALSAGFGWAVVLLDSSNESRPAEKLRNLIVLKLKMLIRHHVGAPAEAYPFNLWISALKRKLSATDTVRCPNVAQTMGVFSFCNNNQSDKLFY